MQPFVEKPARSLPQAIPQISVVIPFFQREANILRRALGSVFAQTGGDECGVNIIVVDDGSPIAASAELAGMVQPLRFPVRIIARANGGPGAARNTALDHVPADTRYVAFLDSDDEWSPDHLRNARAALEAGHDAYFADLMQLNASVSAFRRARKLDLAQHPLIGGQPHLHSYAGDMFNQIATGNVIGTSTVVYRVDRFPTLRFRPEFRSAGEDYLFWMDLALAGARFAFSSRIEAHYGRGVNVYAGATWGSIELLWRIHDEMRYRIFSMRHYSLSQAQRITIARHRLALRDQFVKSLLHRLVRLRPVPLQLLRSQLARDPQTLLALLRAGIGFPARAV